MLNPKKTRHWSDGQNSSGGKAGGPGGAPTQPHPDPADAAALTLDDARAISDLYLRGAAARFVHVGALGIVQIRGLREAGLIETMPDVSGRATAKLTARGRQAVVAASRIIASAPPAGRGV